MWIGLFTDMAEITVSLNSGSKQSVDVEGSL